MGIAIRHSFPLDAAVRLPADPLETHGAEPDIISLAADNEPFHRQLAPAADRS